MGRIKGMLIGAKAGDRDRVLRLKLSEKEKMHIDAIARSRGISTAYYQRQVLVAAGALPEDTPLHDSNPRRKSLAGQLAASELGE